jgi:hypothetical protein
MALTRATRPARADIALARDRAPYQRDLDHRSRGPRCRGLSRRWSGGRRPIARNEARCRGHCTTYRRRGLNSNLPGSALRHPRHLSPGARFRSRSAQRECGTTRGCASRSARVYARRPESSADAKSLSRRLPNLGRPPLALGEHRRRKRFVAGNRAVPRRKSRKGLAGDDCSRSVRGAGPNQPTLYGILAGATSARRCVEGGISTRQPRSMAMRPTSPKRLSTCSEQLPAFRAYAAWNRRGFLAGTSMQPTGYRRLCRMHFYGPT